MSCSFEGLRDWIIGAPRDDDLERMSREESSGETIRRGKHSILRRDPRESFEGFLSKIVIAFVTGESVHTNQRDRRDGICSWRGRILERLAANIESPHRRGVERPVEKAAAFCIAIACDRKVHGFFRCSKIARLERGFVSIQQSEHAENLIVE